VAAGIAGLTPRPGRLRIRCRGRPRRRWPTCPGRRRPSHVQSKTIVAPHCG